MPLKTETITEVLDYCHRDLRPRDWYKGVFNFITDQDLKERLALEYYSARYIYKLGEALHVDGEMLYSHAKYQIMQYASIYEGVIVYLLWNNYAQHPALADIEWHTTYRKAADWPKNLSAATADGAEPIYLCTEVKARTSKISIRFDDKVDAIVKIGCIETELGEEIKKFFKLRNGLHIENAVKNSLTYELDMAQLAFRRIWAFTQQIRGFLNTGEIPEDAKLKSPTAPLTGEDAERLEGE